MTVKRSAGSALLAYSYPKVKSPYLQSLAWRTFIAAWCTLIAACASAPSSLTCMQKPGCQMIVTWSAGSDLLAKGQHISFKALPGVL